MTFTSKSYFTLLSAILLLDNAVFVKSVATVNLGTAGNFAILAKAGITTTVGTSIVGNLGISPAAATAITGFGLILSADATYSTSALVAPPAKIFAANYAPPTPSIMTTAVFDMLTAYNDAAGRLNPDYLNVGAGRLNGNNLAAGLYSWTTTLSIGGTVTISGSSTDIWIFQVQGTLTFDSGAQILLAGGALCSNIFWQASGQVTFGSTSKPLGIFLGKTGIVFNSAATLACGRALAQTAVTMIGNAVTQP